MRRGRLLSLTLAASLAVGLLLAPGAHALFHLMKVREVHAGGMSGGSYVELQMYNGGQNFVSGHDVVVYDGSGSPAHSFEFPENVSDGQSQATILLAGSGYEEGFEEAGGPAPDFTDPGLEIPAAGGGAVCFENIDCVSWGDFNGAGSLPSATGSPASPGGVTAGKALHRSIAEPCATWLEPTDDSDDSATDFSERDPEPRSNSSEIVEEECAPPDETAPDTFIDSQPSNPSRGDVSFTYHSSEGDSTFECSLVVGAAAEAFEECSVEGKDYAELPNGEHTFKVRAEDSSGNIDLSPASYTWTVEESAPDVTPPPPPLVAPPPLVTPPLPLLQPPGILAAGRTAPVRGSIALLRARCRGLPGARCSGALRLVARVRRNARTSGRRARNVVVGRARYGLPAGNRRVVRVRLTGKGRRLLRRAGRRGLGVRLVGPGVRNRTLKLRPARRAKRRGGAATSASSPTIAATGDGYGGFIWSPSTADVNAGGAMTFKSGSPTVPHGVTWTGGPESPSCSGVPIDEGKTSWSGSCAFAQAGTYAFVCTVHPSEMKGAITVGSGGADTTNPPPPPPPPPQSSPGEPVARGLKVARAQRGRSVRGSIVVSRPGSGARLRIDLLARRAKLFRAKHRGRVRVGRLVRSGLRAGRVSFRVHLKRFVRRALRRQRRLPLTVRVIVTSPQRDALKLTRKVVLRV